MTGPVHFIWLGGEWLPQYDRSIETARVHGPRVNVWCANGEMPNIDLIARWADLDATEIAFRPLSVPTWLADHPIQLANVKDFFMWQILYEHGGIYLDLDTISLRPAWDLLEKDAPVEYGWNVVVSREYHPDDTHPDPYNSAVVLGRQASVVLRALRFAAGELLRNNVVQWGAVGPRLLTGAVETFPNDIGAAPYRALNGWSYHDIGDYYANPRDPGEETRVIHLYSSDHQDEFKADTWMPTT